VVVSARAGPWALPTDVIDGVHAAQAKILYIWLLLAVCGYGANRLGRYISNHTTITSSGNGILMNQTEVRHSTSHLTNGEYIVW
jgi:hypothetical protein